MNQFHKPSPKLREAPAGLAAFAAASAPSSVMHLLPEPTPEPTPEPEPHGMNVRFTAAEKAALVKLARAERRSQHQILKLLLVPALLEAAAAGKLP